MLMLDVLLPAVAVMMNVAELRVAVVVRVTVVELDPAGMTTDAGSFAKPVVDDK